MAKNVCQRNWNKNREKNRCYLKGLDAVAVQAERQKSDRHMEDFARDFVTVNEVAISSM